MNYTECDDNADCEDDDDADCDDDDNDDDCEDDDESSLMMLNLLMKNDCS